ADVPTRERLGEGDGAIALLGRGAEPDPGAAQRRAVEVHAAAAANDGRARLPVQAVHVRQADQGGVLRLDGLLGRADLQRRPLAWLRFRGVRVAVKAVFGRLITGLNLDEAHVQARILVVGEGQRAGNVDGANHLV